MYIFLVYTILVDSCVIRFSFVTVPDLLFFLVCKVLLLKALHHESFPDYKLDAILLFCGVAFLEILQTLLIPILMCYIYIVGVVCITGWMSTSTTIWLKEI